MSLYANLTGKYAEPWHPVPRWRRALISCVAFVLGVQVKIGAVPYGASLAKHLRTTKNDSGFLYGPPPKAAR